LCNVDRGNSTISLTLKRWSHNSDYTLLRVINVIHYLVLAMATMYQI